MTTTDIVKGQRVTLHPLAKNGNGHSAMKRKGREAIVAYVYKPEAGITLVKVRIDGLFLHLRSTELRAV